MNCNKIANMEDPPLVSIGLPVYNGEKYIREALDSILSQDYPNFEVIIADNASTDDTESICHEYVKRDRRIKYFRRSENFGMVKNFLYTFENASGKYFTLLAHDDLISSKEYLSSTISYMNKHPNVVCCGCSVDSFYDENPMMKTTYSFEWIAPNKNWKEARLEFFHYPTNMDLMIYAMYRSDILKNIKLMRNINKYKKHILILADLCKVGRIVALPRSLRSYRCHVHSITYTHNYPKLDNLLRQLSIKMSLFHIALTFKLPLKEKVKLIKVVCNNFLNFSLVSSNDEIKMLRREMTILSSICKERLELINTLNSEISAITLSDNIKKILISEDDLKRLKDEVKMYSNVCKIRLELINDLHEKNRIKDEKIKNLSSELCEAQQGFASIGFFKYIYLKYRTKTIFRYLIFVKAKINNLKYLIKNGLRG